ncbi:MULTISPECIES: replication initiation protein [Cetobacterium]|uniref:replication initiation protein n=1 Tax=Cetobacterium TaxID=180162 RepID=UPI00163C9A25|nr:MULTISPECIES: replication initiation protein [Cetobacterium]MBC2854170.1 replication initiation protein [Cetobacterium sp. 2G large]WVJ00618.1 replication initiation protein [Cetobacterium somerae]
MENKNIFIEFSKKLSKKERDFLRSVDISSSSVTVHLETLYKIFEVKEEPKVIELEKLLFKFFSKNIVITDSNLNLKKRFNILNSYFFEKDYVTFEFSSHILNEKIKKILKFKERYSYRFYQEILNSEKNILNISMNNLRDILEIQETYDRFYDIEKNLLKPIFKDLTTIGELDIEYEKDKVGEYKSAKILGIKIIKDYKNSETNDVKPVFTLTKTFKNLFELHSELMEIYKKLKGDSSYISNYHFNSKLLVKIYNIKNDETLVYTYKEFTFKILYRKDLPTIIEIFENLEDE